MVPKSSVGVEEKLLQPPLYDGLELLLVGKIQIFDCLSNGPLSLLLEHFIVREVSLVYFNFGMGHCGQS